MIKRPWIYDVEDPLSPPAVLPIVGGNDAVFFKLDQMIVHSAVSGADSLTYVSAAGSLRVQEQMAQHFGTQWIQTQDRHCLSCFFGEGIFGLN